MYSLKMTHFLFSFFLQKSLPLLRQSLFSREMTIEGIRPPPQHVVNTPSSVAQVPQLQVSENYKTIAITN